MRFDDDFCEHGDESSDPMKAENLLTE